MGGCQSHDHEQFVAKYQVPLAPEKRIEKQISDEGEKQDVDGDVEQSTDASIEINKKQIPGPPLPARPKTTETNPHLTPAPESTSDSAPVPTPAPARTHSPTPTVAPSTIPSLPLAQLGPMPPCAALWSGPVTANTRAIAHLAHSMPAWCLESPVDIDIDTFELIKRSWAAVLSGQTSAYLQKKQRFTDLTPQVFFYETFYGYLFDLLPDVRPMYQRAGNGAQGRMLAHMMALIMNMTMDVPRFTIVLQNLARMHNGHGVNAQHYSMLGTILLQSIRVCCGDEIYDEATKQAWIRLYSKMMQIMIPVVVSTPPPPPKPSQQQPSTEQYAHVDVQSQDMIQDGIATEIEKAKKHTRRKSSHKKKHDKKKSDTTSVPAPVTAPATETLKVETVSPTSATSTTPSPSATTIPRTSIIQTLDVPTWKENDDSETEPTDWESVPSAVPVMIPSPTPTLKKTSPPTRTQTLISSSLDGKSETKVDNKSSIPTVADPIFGGGDTDILPGSVPMTKTAAAVVLPTPSRPGGVATTAPTTTGPAVLAAPTRPARLGPAPTDTTATTTPLAAPAIKRPAGLAPSPSSSSSPPSSTSTSTTVTPELAKRTAMTGSSSSSSLAPVTGTTPAAVTVSPSSRPATLAARVAALSTNPRAAAAIAPISAPTTAATVVAPISRPKGLAPAPTPVATVVAPIKAPLRTPVPNIVTTSPKPAVRSVTTAAKPATTTSAPKEAAKSEPEDPKEPEKAPEPKPVPSPAPVVEVKPESVITPVPSPTAVTSSSTSSIESTKVPSPTSATPSLLSPSPFPGMTFTPPTSSASALASMFATLSTSASTPTLPSTPTATMSSSASTSNLPNLSNKSTATTNNTSPTSSSTNPYTSSQPTPTSTSISSSHESSKQPRTSISLGNAPAIGISLANAPAIGRLSIAKPPHIDIPIPSTKGSRSPTDPSSASSSPRSQHTVALKDMAPLPSIKLRPTPAFTLEQEVRPTTATDDDDVKPKSSKHTSKHAVPVTPLPSIATTKAKLAVPTSIIPDEEVEEEDEWNNLSVEKTTKRTISSTSTTGSQQFLGRGTKKKSSLSQQARPHTLKKALDYGEDVSQPIIDKHKSYGTANVLTLDDRSNPSSRPITPSHLHRLSNKDSLDDSDDEDVEEIKSSGHRHDSKESMDEIPIKSRLHPITNGGGRNRIIRPTFS